MQSEELEEAKCSPKADLAGMTFSESLEQATPILKPIALEDLRSVDPKLDSVNPDTPRMVAESSPASSDTEDDARAEAFKQFMDIPKPLHEQNSNESIRTWLQRITHMQNEIQKKLHVSQGLALDSPVKTPPTPSRVVKYQDLPYMGEMTLDNSKPRRGRKPKKADICHLIYKNYGTIFPGTPNAQSIVDRDLATRKHSESQKLIQNQLVDNANRSDVQNRIISSLLEKRLTQESKRQKDTASPKELGQHEPLNLCIRDLDHLKLRLVGTHADAEIKSEPQSDDEVELVTETPSPALSDFKFPVPPEGFSPPAIPPDAIRMPENGVAPGGYVYWPNAGVFIHPMALQQQLLYYQKMAANNNYTAPARPTPESTPDPQELRKIVPKPKSKKTEFAEDESIGESKSKRNSSGGDKTPAKRKRSAIFIPPIPAENQNNPATEVSICKFKFTGGAKPSLQEKKMLSVDSGGNFRYYSGTGDKSMRGYEFFPRETLQQQVNNTQGSSTGAFLQASGEKIYPTSPVDFQSNVSDFMLTPELAPTPAPVVNNNNDLNIRTKKRKSRKSLQREKLEQTFKEKGFLIQTQQLESAEGATYCKFRQLRKFTRYLFRSWKDYLPGNVAENPEGVEKPEDITEHDIENLANIRELTASTSPSP